METYFDQQRWVYILTGTKENYRNLKLAIKIAHVSLYSTLIIFHVKFCIIFLCSCQFLYPVPVVNHVHSFYHQSYWYYWLIFNRHTSYHTKIARLDVNFHQAKSCCNVSTTKGIFQWSHQRKFHAVATRVNTITMWTLLVTLFLQPLLLTEIS